MTPIHLANVALHVLAGTLGLAIGFSLLMREKGTPTHRTWGRRFAYATLVVSLSAAVGSVFFRFLPLFAVLNVVVTYELVSGWRVIYTKEKGPALIDAVWTVLGALAALALVPILFAHADEAAPTVLYATLGALAVLLVYDTLRWVFPRSWHRVLWRYEHVYKIVSALFGMLSALVGNVVRFGQPWSQVIPSVIGVWVIVWFFVRLSRSHALPLEATPR